VTTTRKEFAKAEANGRKRVSITAEMGVPTGQRWATFYEDFLPQLRGHNAVKYYREMSDNDATIGAILFGIEMLIRQVDWPVEPGGETPADEEAAAYLESCKDDMSHSWPDFISTVLSFLPYGWSFHEIVYKLRDGDNSQFDDGRVGWRKLAHQPQETLWEWDLDSHGGVQGFKWTAGGLKGEIPIEKGLLFRTTTARGPNGRSVLRNAFRSYQFKKRLEEILVIGVDRDLNGLPVFGMPAEDVIDQGEMFEEAKKLVTRIHRDEQWGVVLPLEYDESGNALYSFDVMRSDAHLSLNSTAVYISQLSNAIADVVLAGFINLGKDAVGSRALAEPKQQLFQKALQGWVDGIAEVLNRHAVPRLFELNDFNLDALPRFVPEEVEDTALEELGKFVTATAQAGMDWGFLTPDDPISDQMRQLAGFDAAPVDPELGVSKGVEFDTVRQVYKLKE
jgi:hypothetical protein